ncbi:membrane protein [Virgisporangium aliadipatigenens]|uniref:Membrane protein n=1 Tax=Virgisporangium aliadipatigenens TaxID=741659 RepID=A0A8J3YP96_9ACTN|nr:MMPL family transporter [Virgisporangium aliadipatigenens]GIJ48062.1 membrane protein [Virgisporangium aliadipatigenens]
MSGAEAGTVHRVLGRIGRGCAAHPRRVLGAWLLLVVAVVLAVVAYGRPVDNEVGLPGSDAQTARDLVHAHGVGDDGAGGQVVVHVGTGRLDESARQAALTEAVAAIAAVDHVVVVTPPATGQGTLSADGRTGYLTVELDVPAREVDRSLAAEVDAAATPLRAHGVRTSLGGALAAAADRGDSRLSELIGLVAAAVVLVLAFGGLVAAGLPILTALLTLTCAVGAVGLAGHITGVPGVASTLATMIGLGVGIDYALFVITRHRELLARGVPVPEAVARSMAGSGSAVVFAGGTVVIALGGLAVAGVPILTTLAWSTGVAVVVAVAGAVTLLPALLALLGARVDALRLTRAPATDGTTGWARRADRVTRRPWRYAMAATALLGLLAAPALSLRLGQTDAGDAAPGSAGRTSYDLLAAGLGPGVNGPLTVVVVLDPPATGADDPRLATARTDLSALPGVASVAPARPSPDGAIATLRVIPTTGPGDPATAALVETVRDTPVAGTTAHVGGVVATKADLAGRVGERMWYVIAVVVVLSTVLLYLAFGAPVVAVKAAVMNLVSIGAAYGALTTVFAWGWGATLIGLDGPVPVESYVPMMLFALLFGLSMDYEVFLLTAVQEAWRRTGDNRASVRAGLAATGRVITSAAFIMVVVFAGFLLHSDPVIKMFGLGMAVAIAVDATVVRGLLVPAVMALLGPANWWHPGRSPAIVPTAGTPSPVTVTVPHDRERHASPQ